MHVGSRSSVVALAMYLTKVLSLDNHFGLTRKPSRLTINHTVVLTIYLNSRATSADPGAVSATTFWQSQPTLLGRSRPNCDF